MTTNVVRRHLDLVAIFTLAVGYPIVHVVLRALA